MVQTNSPDTQRTPGLINWLGYLALTFLLALPAAVLTVRAGVWQQGLLIYAISCLAAVLLLALSAILLLLPRFAPWRKAIATRAAFTLPGTLLVLSLLAGGSYPPIHDISTDLQDPPVFTAAQQVRGPDSNSLDIDPETIAQQQTAYPDLQPIIIRGSIDEAFDLAVQAATELGWDIYLQDRNAGTIEAVATTNIMGFKDDVVIRVRGNAEGSRVDLRSVSRVGVSDVGANAKRIRAFSERLQGH